MKLILAIDLIRHAARTSVHHIPGIFTHLAEDDMGKLTLKGKKDAIKLGQKFKQYYIDEHALLADSYQPETILIKSSNFQRTKETARCVMQGMYASQSKLANIEALPEQEDLLFLGFLYAPGREMQNLIRVQHDLSINLSKDATQEINLILKSINNKLGTKFNDISDIVKIADIIKTSKEHERLILEKITNEEMTKILHFAKLVFIEIFKSPAAVHAGAGNLIKQTMKNMVAKIENQTSLKYILFSGHDTNLLSAMGLLDLPLEDVPYLANLRFELFQKNNTEFFVKIFCIDSYIKIHSEEYCPFDQFEAIINDKFDNKYLKKLKLA